MTNRSILGGAAAAALLVLAAGGPVCADGLGKFEQAIKPQLPPNSLTYKNAKGLGDSGFVLEDVVVTAPPEQTGKKSEPVEIKRITVEDFDFGAIDKKNAPNFARMRFEGIKIKGKPAEGVDLDELAGINGLTADFQLDYRLDPDRQTFTLNRLELDLSGLARIELTMVLDGVSAEVAGDPSQAMDKTSLRTASLVLEDRSLLGKAVPAIAKSQGSEAGALLTSLKPLAAGFRDQGPGTQAALDAVVSFVEDYKAPKGPLRLTLNPPDKTSATKLSSANGPEDLVKALGLIVSYSGTRPMSSDAPAKPGDAGSGGPAGSSKSDNSAPAGWGARGK